jgi:hypothetical protein
LLFFSVSGETKSRDDLKLRSDVWVGLGDNLPQRFFSGSDLFCTRVIHGESSRGKAAAKSPPKGNLDLAKPQLIDCF